jgi:hypothetical protein
MDSSSRRWLNHCHPADRECADGVIPLTDSASKPARKQFFIPSRSFAEKEENAQAAQAARIA